MKRIISKLKAGGFLLAIFVCSTAVAQDARYYAFIPNSAGDIDRDGFNIGYHSIYSQWDLNRDGDVSENEFYTVFFKRLDANKDGSLSPMEWAQGSKYIFSRANVKAVNGQGGGFKRLDTNNDKKITPGEFDAVIRNTGIFRNYDSNQNGKLDRKELNNGVFKNMDLDGNGMIERREFATVRSLFIN